jgi:hypothetical protein
MFFSFSGIAAQQVTCGSVQYHDAETTAPATCFVASSGLHRTTFSKLALEI